jgi:hypothetical protein
VLELPAKAGEDTVEANLLPWVEELLRLLRENQPIFFALMGDRHVFTRFKERLRERQTGPIAVFRAAAAYVEAEQALGRIDARLEPEVVASILIGACRDRTLTRTLVGIEAEPPSTFAEQLVQTVVFGLAPATPHAQKEPS